MRRVILVMALALFGVAQISVANEGEFFSEVEYYRKLAEKQLAEAQAQVEEEPEIEYEPEPVYEVIEKPQMPAVTAITLPPPMPELYEPVYMYKECVEEAPAPPKNVIVAIPQYFNSTNKSAKFDVGGTKLKMSAGHANGAGITLLYNRVFSDVFSVAFMYEYGFMNVRGGMAVPDAPGIGGVEDSRWHSHVLGILPEFNFGKWGKLQLSLIQGFDRASGSETMTLPDGSADRRSIDDYGTNVTSLMAWYEKDFDIGCDGFKLTPYAGWRSLYVSVKDQNIFAKAPGTREDDNLWVHLLSGGMKASYQKGAFNFHVRGGVSYRTTKDDVPGYGNRAVAPGVVQFSHRANLDRTVGSFGAGINFAIKKRAMVGIGYDGTVGKNTASHTGTLSFALPF